MPVAKLPYTYVIKKPNGREYWRFRRGALHTALPSAPGEAVYHAKYAELLALSEAEGPTQAAEGSVRALTKAYRGSAEFKALRDATRTDYERTLDLIDNELGDEPYRYVTTTMVKAVRDDHAATPRKAHKLKQMVSRLYTWAAEDGRVKKGYNPAADFKRLKVRTRSITPWSDAEIALFLAHAPKHLKLAVQLLLYTGQRCEDVVSMDWTLYQGDFIRVRQSKTGEPIDIACHPTLRAALDGAKTRFKGNIIRNANGRPYRANALAKAIADQCAKIEAMPSGRSPHGLRYAAAGAMEAAGCTVGQIISVLGHRTYQMGVKYLMGRRESAAAIDRQRRLA